jgi:hypothetical protein
MDWAYHVTMKSFLPSILKDGLRPTAHEHTHGEPVIFVEDDEEQASIYHEPPKTVMLRFKVPWFGTTDDGEYVHHDVVRPEDLQVKTRLGFEALLVAMRRIEACRQWAALQGRANKVAVLETAADKLVVAFPVVLRNTAGFRWGFYSNEDQRMHLQVVPQKGEEKLDYRVWLETRGQRTFEPNDMPASVKKLVLRAVTDYQKHVEAEWVRLMIKQDWLRYRYAAGVITLDVYPESHHAFTRTIDLRKRVNKKMLAALTADDIAFNLDTASINLFVHRPEHSQLDFFLPEFVFEGTRSSP